jgi:hypothetical protein
MQQAWLGMPLLLSRLPQYPITCSMTTTDGQHDRTGGPGGVTPKQTVPAYGLLSVDVWGVLSIEKKPLSLLLAPKRLMFK